MANLVLFDLDGTLIQGDSDFEWGDFMCEVGAVDAQKFREKNQLFYKQYLAGKLDVDAYLKFALQPFSQWPIQKMLDWRKTFIASRIQPLISDADKDLVKRHCQTGDQTVIITATNRFVTEPIAKLFSVDALIATELEIRGEKYTGLPSGIPCFKEGKIKRFQTWLKNQNSDHRQVWFYSDSINDLPLLEYVDKPIIKNGDKEITQIAKQRGWEVLP